MSDIAKKVLVELLEEVEDVSSTVKAWAQAKLDKLEGKHEAAPADPVPPALPADPAPPAGEDPSTPATDAPAEEEGDEDLDEAGEGDDEGSVQTNGEAAA